MSEIAVGDELTIGGVYEDGTTCFDGVGLNKPIQKWKCVAVYGEDCRLIPLHQDGSVDEFNAAAGEFWLKAK